MLFIRNLNQIRMHRGDSFTETFKVLTGTELDFSEYTFTENDKIYFGLMEPNQPWENAIAKKLISYSDLKISLNPKDTMCLLPGLYYYQIKCKLGTGEVYTLLPKNAFYILE